MEAKESELKEPEEEIEDEESKPKEPGEEIADDPRGDDDEMKLKIITVEQPTEGEPNEIIARSPMTLEETPLR